MGWISPTGDSGADWTDRSNARDNDGGTYATSILVGYLVWTGYLTLTHSGVYCDQVRVANQSHDTVHAGQIDVYYDGAWHSILDADNPWTSPGYKYYNLDGPHTVTSLRLRYQQKAPTGTSLSRITDVWFSEVIIVAPTVSTQAASSVGENGATLNGNITNTGGENCDERGFDWGLTDSYGDSWTQEGSYGTGAFNHAISGLLPGTTYHYRAKAHNSAGWGYGADVEFTTDVHEVSSSDVGSGIDATGKARTWGGFLELIIATITAYRVRFMALKEANVDFIDLDIYYGGDWHHLYQGSFDSMVWESKSFDQQTTVTKARVRFFQDPTYTVKLYELEFYAVITS